MTTYKKALVTGGAGFIGSHVVDALIEKGIEVHIVDDLSTGQRENLNPKATLHECSLLDMAFEALVKDLVPDVIFHLAAQVNLRHSVIDPPNDARINVLGTLNVAHFAGKYGVKKVIYSSTGGPMYPEDAELPYAETVPPSPISPYGISKRSGEMYLHFAHRVHGLSYVALRYSNVYGPRQNAKGEAGVISIFSERMLRGEPVGITGSGEQTRDFVFVEDVARANMLAMESDFTGIVNISTEKETDINEVFSTLKQLLHYEGEAQKLPAAPGEVMRSVLSYQKAKDVLGWEPVYSLEQGLEKTITWFRASV